MESTKYIGMDVHKDAISIAVLNSSGKLVMESIIETKAITILEFVHGLRGSLYLTFEEGTWAAWLYDLLKPHVTKLVVCDPRRNDYLKQGSKSDRIDARKLAELLRSNLLRPVYHGEHGVRPLKELAQSYLTIPKDQARVMTRVKAVYRSWAIPCAGKQVYGQRHRLEWLGKIQEAGVRRRAEFYYVQLDALRSLRLVVRRELLLESRKHGASKRLSQIPSIGPIRAALLIALLQTPDRFRTKRQLWAYSGLAIETHDSAENQYVNGQLQRSHKRYAVVRSVPSLCSGKREQILLNNKRGWKSTKIRPKVKCFLLTSPLIELCRKFGFTFPDSRFFAHVDNTSVLSVIRGCLQSRHSGFGKMPRGDKLCPIAYRLC
jgi:transposase